MSAAAILRKYTSGWTAILRNELLVLLLPIKSLTFVGLSRRLRVVYSRGLQCWSDFWCKSAKSENGSKIWCFLGRRPPKSEFEGSKPPKGTCTKQNTSFELLRVRIGWKLRPVGEMRKRKKKGRTFFKSQKCDISPLCGGAPCEPISTKFGVFVGLANVITYARNGYKISIGFSRTTGGKTHVSL